MQATVAVADRTRCYTVVGDTAGRTGRPLVLVFHGSKQDGQAHRKFTGAALDELADGGRAVVAYLDGYRGNWNDARAASSFPARTKNVDDVAFARAVVDAVAESHNIDRSAVIGMGYSNGGQMVFRLLHDADGLLAGAVVVAATMPNREGFLGEYSETAKRAVPLALVAGTSDRIVPFDGGRMAWWARAIFRVDGTALSANRTAEYFARRNGITSAPTGTAIAAAANARQGTTMHETMYQEAGLAPVTLYTVVRGGHAVPGATAAPPILGRTGSARGIATIVGDVLSNISAA